MFDDFILANQIVRIGMRILSVNSFDHIIIRRQCEHFYVLLFMNAILVLSFNTHFYFFYFQN